MLKDRVKLAFSALTKPAEKAVAVEEQHIGKDISLGAFSDELFGELLGNPADLIKRKGYGIIDEMRKDDAIGSFLTMRKAARLSTLTDIEAASDSNVDMRVAESIRWSIYEFCDTPVSEMLRHLYTANDYGFSLQEKVLVYVDDGPYSGNVAYERIVPMKPHQFQFKLKEGKRVADMGVIQTAGYGRPKPLPYAKYMHYAYNSDWGSPYGNSDVEPCYPWYIMKKYFRRFWGIYGERTASGFLDAAFNGKVTAPEQEELKKMLKGAASGTWFMHPEDVTIDLKESNGAAGQTYPQAIDRFNIYMARRLLTPDLLGFSAKPQGSYALGKTHLDVYQWVLQSMAADAQRVIRDGIIRPLVILNFGADYPLPRFVFKPLSTAQATEALTAFYGAITAGIFNPEDITDEHREWVSKLLAAPHSERPEENRKQTPGFTPADKQDPPAKAEAEELVFSAGLSRKLLPIERKVNFAALESSLDSLEEQAIGGWRAIALDQRDTLIKVIRKRRLIEEKNNRGVAELSLRKVGEIQRLLSGTLVTQYLNGRWEAAREIKDTISGRIELADIDSIDILLEPLPPAKAMKYFKDLGLKVAASDLVPYTQNAFSIAGVESQKILAECKRAIYKGIREGNAYKAEAEIKAIFDKYVETGELKGGAVSEAWHIKTVVETNIADALSAGRRESFEDADVANEVEAYMISAVMDAYTTDLCAGLDQRIVSKDELAAYGWPPYHYNCRTIIVPIVRGEAYEIKGIPAGSKHQFQPGGRKPLLRTN